nr:Chain C, Protein SIC1 [Saccharomyces cerevisiae]6G86_D Chain D, Protein SIC1 [Saccharomyces cerevisiae]
PSTTKSFKNAPLLAPP